MTKKNTPRKRELNSENQAVEKAASLSNPNITVAAPLRPVRQRIRSIARTPDAKAPLSTGASETSYAVGYRKPPAHSQFKPGESGNPKGRKKDAKGMKTLAKQMLTERISVHTAGGTKKMTRMDALLHKMVELGMKGNPRMLLGLIQLYEKSVSENLPSEAEQSSLPLTQTDEAILEMMKDILLGEGNAS